MADAGGGGVSGTTGSGGTSGAEPGWEGGTVDAGSCGAPCRAGECPVESVTPGHMLETKGLLSTPEHIYFATGDGIGFVHKPTGSMGTVPGSLALNTSWWVAGTRDLLLWTSFNDGTVFSIALNPPGTARLIADTAEIAGQFAVTERGRVVTSQSHVYWTTKVGFAGLWRAGLDGAQPEAISTGGAPEGVALDATHVYWVDTDAARVFRKPIDTLAGAAEPFATTEPKPSMLVLVSGVLSWVTDAGAVQSKSTSLGPADAPTTYVSNEQQVPKGVTADDKYVYWTVYRNEAANGRGEVYRAPVGTPMPQLVATGDPYAFAMVNDECFVYWAINNLDDDSAGKIYRVPKPTL